MPPGAHVQRAAIAVIGDAEAQPPQPRCLHAEQQRQLPQRLQRDDFPAVDLVAERRSRAPGGRRSPRCRSCRPCGRGCATEYWRRNSLLRPQLLHRLPQGLAGGGGVQRTTGLFRIVTVAGAPAGPRRRIVAPVGGIDHLLFALQRGGDRLIKACSRCGIRACSGRPSAGRSCFSPGSARGRSASAPR